MKTRKPQQNRQFSNSNVREELQKYISEKIGETTPEIISEEPEYGYRVGFGLPRGRRLSKNPFIIMLRSLNRVFQVPFERMSIYIYTDSSDWDEVIGDKDNLIRLVRNGRNELGDITVTPSLDFDLIKALAIFFADTCTVHDKCAFLLPTKFIITENGFFVSIAMAKPKTPDTLKAQLHTSPLGQSILSFFSDFGYTAEITVLGENADELNKLIKHYKIGMSGVKASKILMGHGLLEERVETDASGKEKKYKVLTEQGMTYGYNMTKGSKVVPQFYKVSFRTLVTDYLRRPK